MTLITVQMLAETQARQRAAQTAKPMSPITAKRLREEGMGLRAARNDN